MNSREKLNVGWSVGIFIVASAVGLVFQSWIVFLVAILGLAVLAASQGHIRGTGGPDHPKQ